MITTKDGTLIGVTGANVFGEDPATAAVTIEFSRKRSDGTPAPFDLYMRRGGVVTNGELYGKPPFEDDVAAQAVAMIRAKGTAKALHAKLEAWIVEKKLVVGTIK